MIKLSFTLMLRAKEASVNKPAEKQAVKGAALASATACVLSSIEKITTSQSRFYHIQMQSSPQSYAVFIILSSTFSKSAFVSLLGTCNSLINLLSHVLLSLVTF